MSGGRGYLAHAFNGNKAWMITVLDNRIIWIRPMSDDRNMDYMRKHWTCMEDNRCIWCPHRRLSDPFLSCNGSMSAWWNQHHSGINAIISCWKHEWESREWKWWDESFRSSHYLIILCIICFHAFMWTFNADRLNPMQVRTVWLSLFLIVLFINPAHHYRHLHSLNHHHHVRQ